MFERQRSYLIQTEWRSNELPERFECTDGLLLFELYCTGLVECLMSLPLGLSSWLVSFFREDSPNLLPEGAGFTASIPGITEKRVLGDSPFILQKSVTQSSCCWQSTQVPVPSPDITGFPFSIKVYCQGRHEAVTQWHTVGDGIQRRLLSHLCAVPLLKIPDIANSWDFWGIPGINKAGFHFPTNN